MFITDGARWCCVACSQAHDELEDSSAQLSQWVSHYHARSIQHTATTGTGTSTGQPPASMQWYTVHNTLTRHA